MELEKRHEGKKDDRNARHTGEKDEHGSGASPPKAQPVASSPEETKMAQVSRRTSPPEDMNLIVRIANVDLDGKKPVARAVTKIKGIGTRAAGNIATAFEKETGQSAAELLGKISEEDAKKLEKIVQGPQDFGIPSWSLNRRKDFETGEDRHLVMADLDFSMRQDIQRLSETKSYRGFRHTWKLPVRGQSTKSTHRGKGGVVGVTKKEAKAASAAAKPATKTAPTKAK